MRKVQKIVVALSVACAATGCSVYDDLTTSDFAKQDGDAIVAAASEAMLDVQSMRITGQARTKGNQFFVDLRMDRGPLGPDQAAEALRAWWAARS